MRQALHFARYVRRMREVESYRLIDVLIIAGLTALLVIHVANFAHAVA
ncbi:hypothetical protein [Alsobacter sp. R-9]